MNRDEAFETWYKGEFGYELDPNVVFGQDAAFRSAFEAGAKFERDRARRLLAEKAAFAKVENIPVPWNYENQHTVVAVEFPPDRSLVVDLVFSDGTKMSEAKGLTYAFNSDDNFWTLILDG